MWKRNEIVAEKKRHVGRLEAAAGTGAGAGLRDVAPMSGGSGTTKSGAGAPAGVGAPPVISLFNRPGSTRGILNLMLLEVDPFPMQWFPAQSRQWLLVFMKKLWNCEAKRFVRDSHHDQAYQSCWCSAHIKTTSKANECQTQAERKMKSMDETRK